MEVDQTPAEETHRCNPDLFEDWRYKALTDKDLAYITEEIRGYADGIRKQVSALRNAIWEELDRMEGFPLSPAMKDADEVNAFFGTDRRYSGRDWRKLACRAAMASEANPKWGHGQADAPVVLNGPDKPVIVLGKTKPPLPSGQYGAVEALANAHASNERLSKTQLENRAKDAQGRPIEDPVGALERLCKKAPDWKQVIDMAGTPGRGYSLRSKPPTTTENPPTTTCQATLILTPSVLY
jgi:hypothetical protein